MITQEKLHAYVSDHTLKVMASKYLSGEELDLFLENINLKIKKGDDVLKTLLTAEEMLAVYEAIEAKAQEVAQLDYNENEDSRIRLYFDNWKKEEFFKNRQVSHEELSDDMILSPKKIKEYEEAQEKMARMAFESVLDLMKVMRLKIEAYLANPSSYPKDYPSYLLHLLNNFSFTKPSDMRYASWKNTGITELLKQRGGKNWI